MKWFGVNGLGYLWKWLMFLMIFWTVTNIITALMRFIILIVKVYVFVIILHILVIVSLIQISRNIHSVIRVRRISEIRNVGDVSLFCSIWILNVDIFFLKIEWFVYLFRLTILLGYIQMIIVQITTIHFLLFTIAIVVCYTLLVLFILSTPR